MSRWQSWSSTPSVHPCSNSTTKQCYHTVSEFWESTGDNNMQKTITDGETVGIDPSWGTNWCKRGENWGLGSSHREAFLAGQVVRDHYWKSFWCCQCLKRFTKISCFCRLANLEVSGYAPKQSCTSEQKARKKKKDFDWHFEDVAVIRCELLAWPAFSLEF